MKKVLIVEDDKDISELIQYNLTKDGYEVSTVFDGLQALEAAARISPDLIILDIMLPSQDGLDVCRQLKADNVLKNVPIIMLTAKSEESDVIVGLQMGADDYLAKPFSVKVLLARVKAVLRRFSQIETVDVSQKRQFGRLTIDLNKHKISFNDKVIPLTSIEFDILEFLSRTPGRVYTREQILDKVWKDGKFIIDRAVDVHIRGMRKKLGDAEDFVETVRGVGYCFKELD